ncbi:hypothetical protein C1645_828542 [Glomus cerebriforme]|uniref:Uncharacterized protein n=1 Tax=Glomus cerebriforme TaxID=658196 RepID=A0A397SMJ9_9GLOM|nr:hypothetical protein C1645_828542 [Glomus cerebriforme]
MILLYSISDRPSIEIIGFSVRPYFSCIKNYEVLEIMIVPFIQELDDLKNNGLIINEVRWNFELYLVQIGSFWQFALVLILQIQIFSILDV